MRIFEILHIVNEFHNDQVGRNNIEMGISEFFKDSDNLREFQIKYREFETILKNSMQIKLRELENKEKSIQLKEDNNPNQWLTVKEFVERKYKNDPKPPTEATVRNWCKANKIKFKKDSERGYRVHVSELTK